MSTMNKNPTIKDVIAHLNANSDFNAKFVREAKVS